MEYEKLINSCEKNCKAAFERAESIALFNQKKVLDAFKESRIALRHFEQTSGYAYDDQGRAALSAVFRDTFKADAALVSPLFMSGTHTITVALMGLLRPGDTCLSVTGQPYDTLNKVISGSGTGSLKDFNINFHSVPLTENSITAAGKDTFVKNSAHATEDKSKADSNKEKENSVTENGKSTIHNAPTTSSEGGKFDFEKIKSDIECLSPSMIYLQRSKGYTARKSFGIDDIKQLVGFVRRYTSAPVVVDNCYGEFVEEQEPLEAGADLIIGSLIKNPGGGFAPTGGYIAGKQSLISRIEGRYSAPGVGFEIGACPYGYRSFFQGLFMAPHTVLQAVKSYVLFGEVFRALGFEVIGESHEFDIVRAIKFSGEEQLLSFVRAIQAASPVDSSVVPHAWDMPGYKDKVIMAAGTFMQGASIELSADAPVRPPYIAYVQGALTYEHAKIACIAAAKAVGGL